MVIPNRELCLAKSGQTIAALVTSSFKNGCPACHPPGNFVQPATDNKLPIERRFLQNDRIGLSAKLQQTIGALVTSCLKNGYPACHPVGNSSRRGQLAEFTYDERRCLQNDRVGGLPAKSQQTIGALVTTM